MTHRRHRTPRLATLIVAVVLTLTSCAFGPQAIDQPARTAVFINVVDERGAPVTDATVELIDTHGRRRTSEHRADHNGVARLEVSDPAVIVVSAPGRLDEPAVIGPDDNGLTIALWDREDDRGRPRVSMHFGGDVMLGRRYLDLDRPTASASTGVGARRIVRHLAPLAERADWTVVNLETVVGDLDDDGALVAKRFLLRSEPFIVDALDEMGVDVVALGNNHAYDWGPTGLIETFEILEAAGIGHVGAGLNADDAIRGRLDDVGGISVGTVSFTTVNGDYVNDQLPVGTDAVPPDVPAVDAWQYELRRFGYSGDGVTIPTADRLIGDAWREFADRERSLEPTIAAELWDALTDVYPELQDWVARRGHGGAAAYRADEVAAEITRLRREGADVVVVQLHGGFQFAEVASDFVRRVARRSIDAGADLVVGHHPHVLQGVEWYGTGLIAHSLGNLVFDQDFAATFPSAMLRVVTDGDRILEARIIPVVIDRYRPKPVAGRSATTILRLVDHRSAMHAVSDRVVGRVVGTVHADIERSDTALRQDGNSAVIERQRTIERWSADLAPGEVVDLPACALVRADLLATDVEVGSDRFGWGHFADETVDGFSRPDDGADRRLPVGWRVPADPARWAIVDGPAGFSHDLALRMITDPNSATTTSLISNVDLAPHRLFDRDGSPVDAPARLEVRLSARRDRGELPLLRIASFEFDDTDPTSNPVTERVANVELPVEVPDDHAWHQIAIEVPDEVLVSATSGRTANKANLLIDAPPAIFGTLDLDDIRIIEWRGRTDATLPAWVEADVVRSESGGEVHLTISRC